MTTDILPGIFDLYVECGKYDGVEAWCTLVQVCWKWRNIVLESPGRLNLRIRYHPTTRVREKLRIWSTMPVVLSQYDDEFLGRGGQGPSRRGLGTE